MNQIFLKLKVTGLWSVSYTHLYVVNKAYTISHGTERRLYDNIKDPYQMNPLRLNDCKEDKTAEFLEGKLRECAEKYKDKFEF